MKMSIKDDEASFPQKVAQDNRKVKLQKKISTPPLPSKLPNK